MAVLAAAETVVEGEYAVSKANGQVGEASAIVVTITAGGFTVKGDKAQPDEAATGGYPSEGRIVGQFRDTRASTGLVALTSFI